MIAVVAAAVYAYTFSDFCKRVGIMFVDILTSRKTGRTCSQRRFLSGRRKFKYARKRIDNVDVTIPPTCRVYRTDIWQFFTTHVPKKMSSELQLEKNDPQQQYRWRKNPQELIDRIDESLIDALRQLYIGAEARDFK